MRWGRPGGQGMNKGMASDKIKYRYSVEAGRQLREEEDCRYSFLPYQALVLISSAWFEACEEGMLRGNYGPIEDWLRATASIAASQGYELEDMLRMMRICRRVAIEKEGWVPAQLEALDEVIDETLQLINSEVSWDIPEGLKYLQVGKPDEEVEEIVEPEPKVGHGERRLHKRAYLKLPVRVRGWITDLVVEVTTTDNVARGGLCFETLKDYPLGQTVRIIYPYREDSTEVDQEMPAKIVRIDKRDYVNLVAVKFLVDLSTGKPTVE